MLALGDEKVRTRLEAVWGSIRPTSNEKTSLITKYKNLLASDQHPAGDPGRGPLVFKRTCNQCHKLFDSGGEVGLDLTGSDRANSDYILENVLDPAPRSLGNTPSPASPPRTAALSPVSSASKMAGQSPSRPPRADHPPAEDIEEIKPSTVSMMPEGQLERLTPQEVRDLFAYLAASRQVQLPDEAR